MSLMILVTFIIKHVGVYWLNEYRASGSITVKQIEVSLALFVLFFFAMIIELIYTNVELKDNVVYFIPAALLLIVEFFVAIFYQQFKNLTRKYLMGEIKLTDPNYRSTYFMLVERKLYWSITLVYLLVGFIGFYFTL